MTLTQSEIESQLADLQTRVADLENARPAAPETTTVDTPEGVENVVNPGEDLGRTDTNPELDPHQPGVEPEVAPKGEGTAPVDPAGGEMPQPQPAAEASEKPLYTSGTGELPDGYTPSGLATTDGRVLFHFDGDTAGEPHTGELPVYADEVLPAPAPEGEPTS